VNRTFWEVLAEYPMGNGLGGGGTSIPYFLASQVNHPVWVENEYCRILLEEGLVGLLLWIGFIVWFVSTRAGFAKDEWLTGRRMAYYLCILIFLTGAIGVGTLSAVPHTFLFMLCIGWTSVRPERARTPVKSRIAPPARMPLSMGARAY
jgi:O-antigen ligase